MKNTSIYNNLILLAAQEAGLKSDEICCHQLSLSGGLYHVSISTAFQRHECLIDPDNMELLGISSQPSGEHVFDMYRHFSA